MSAQPIIRDQISSRLKEYLDNPDHDALNLRELAARFEALPLCVSWEKCWAIRPDGSIVVFSHGSEDPHLCEENNARMINVALFQGSITYPEIKTLIPSRPPDAEDCPYCGGEGTDPDKLEQHNIICYCGGLGWVPRES
jgi:hypothetical protein